MSVPPDMMFCLMGTLSACETVCVCARVHVFGFFFDVCHMELKFKLVINTTETVYLYSHSLFGSETDVGSEDC